MGADKRAAETAIAAINEARATEAAVTAERERIWNGVRALIWMVERHPTKDVIYDAHIRRLARDLKADLKREGAYDEIPAEETRTP